VRKKLMVLALVGLAFVLLTGPVLAAGSSRGTGPAQTRTWSEYHIISFTGTIAYFSGTTIVVDVQMTNKPYIVKRGTRVSVGTTSSTVFYIWDGRVHRWVPDISSLYPYKGAQVSINAIVDTTKTPSIAARRVEMYKPRYAP
jgi:hypothetical protein